MGETLKNFIKGILKGLDIDDGKKKDIMDELMENFIEEKEELIRSGLIEEEAERKIIERFGNPEKISRKLLWIHGFGRFRKNILKDSFLGAIPIFIGTLIILLSSTIGLLGISVKILNIFATFFFILSTGFTLPPQKSLPSMDIYMEWHSLCIFDTDYIYFPNSACKTQFSPFNNNCAPYLSFHLCYFQIFGF